MKDERAAAVSCAYRLSPQAARLLLAALGCRALYGYLPAAPVGREEGLACLAELIRSGLVSNDGNALHIAAPLHTLLQTMADAARVLQVHGEHDACVYLAPSGAVLCGAPAGGPMRLCALSADNLWRSLALELPELDLPDAAPDSVLPDGLTPLPPDADPSALCGADVRLTLLTAAGLPLRRAALALLQGVPLIAAQTCGKAVTVTLFTARQAEKWLVEDS